MSVKKIVVNLDKYKIDREKLVELSVLLKVSTDLFFSDVVKFMLEHQDENPIEANYAMRACLGSLLTSLGGSDLVFELLEEIRTFEKNNSEVSVDSENLKENLKDMFDKGN